MSSKGATTATGTSSSSSSPSSKVAIHWFRKGLRLHDNPAFLYACENAEQVFPVFIIDPHFAKPEKIGVLRYRFMLQTIRYGVGSSVVDEISYSLPLYFLLEKKEEEATHNK